MEATFDINETVLRGLGEAAAREGVLHPPW